MRPTVIASLAAAVVATILFSFNSAHAVPTVVDAQDDPRCDPLMIPSSVHEIGQGAAQGGPFPANEELTSLELPPVGPACIPFNEAFADPVVEITNLTGTDLLDVWYVADHDTLLTNYDGTVAAPFGPLLTFKIDSVGVNMPLIFESIAVDDIWQAGETWQFVIQDWTCGLCAPPSAIDTIGIDSTGNPPSSGSIIALVPEPSGLLLLGLGLAGCLASRRLRA